MRRLSIMVALAVTGLPTVQALATPGDGLPLAANVVVEKQARRLTVFDGQGQAIRIISGIQLGGARWATSVFRAMKERRKADTRSTGAIRTVPTTCRCTSPIPTRRTNPTRRPSGAVRAA